MILIFQIIIIVCILVLAGFFAGTETGIYRVSLFRLRVGIEKKQRFAKLLGKTLADSQGLMFSMLIGTNLTHYIVTSIVTYMFLKQTASPKSAELYTTILIAPILFIFCEVLPKNIYLYRADTLMPRFAPALWFFHKLFTLTGAVGLLKIISRFFTHLVHSPISAGTAITDVRRHQIRQIFRETREEDLLSSTQNEIINRLVNIPNLWVSSVMVPVSKVEMVEVNSDHQMLLTILARTAFTRLPVYEGSRQNIIGFINIYEVLCKEKDFADLHKFIKPMLTFSAETSVLDALNHIRKTENEIAIVTQAGKKPVAGIVTIKDLVEELTGELA